MTIKNNDIEQSREHQKEAAHNLYCTGSLLCSRAMNIMDKDTEQLDEREWEKLHEMSTSLGRATEMMLDVVSDELDEGDFKEESEPKVNMPEDANYPAFCLREASTALVDFARQLESVDVEQMDLLGWNDVEVDAYDIMHAIDIMLKNLRNVLQNVK